MKINRILNEDTIEQAAEKFGNEVKKDAATIDAGEVIDGGAPLGEIGVELDKALKRAKIAQKLGDHSGINVLFVGRGGTGKTYNIKEWARSRGVNLVEKDAKTLDPTDLGGTIGRRYTDDEDNRATNTVTKLSNQEFNSLDKPNSVLFLDELNRARPDVIGSLLELIQNHVVNDQEAQGGKRTLSGYLFTIAAINPAEAGYDVLPLDTAMKGRLKMVSIQPTNQQCFEHIEYKFSKKIDKLKKLQASGENDPEIQQEITSYIGRIAIAQKLLSDSRFEFDDGTEEAKAFDEGYPVLNPRSLAHALEASDGTKESFLSEWDGYCNPEKYELVEDILAGYVDVDDKANDALKYGDENPFAKKREEQNVYDKIANLI